VLPLFFFFCVEEEEESSPDDDDVFFFLLLLLRPTKRLTFLVALFPPRLTLARKLRIHVSWIESFFREELLSGFSPPPPTAWLLFRLLLFLDFLLRGFLLPLSLEEGLCSVVSGFFPATAVAFSTGLFRSLLLIL